MILMEANLVLMRYILDTDAPQKVKDAMREINSVLSDDILIESQHSKSEQ